MEYGIEDAPVTAPRINFHGTDARSLINGFQEARDTLDAAIYFLRLTQPHGRDFVTSPPGAYAKAREEHCARLTRLLDVKEELTHLIVLTHQQIRETN